jgi:hypothetical protein
MLIFRGIVDLAGEVNFFRQRRKSGRPYASLARRGDARPLHDRRTRLARETIGVNEQFLLTRLIQNEKSRVLFRGLLLGQLLGIAQFRRGAVPHYIAVLENFEYVEPAHCPLPPVRLALFIFDFRADNLGRFNSCSATFSAISVETCSNRVSRFAVVVCRVPIGVSPDIPNVTARSSYGLNL